MVVTHWHITCIVGRSDAISAGTDKANDTKRQLRELEQENRTATRTITEQLTALEIEIATNMAETEHIGTHNSEYVPDSTSAHPPCVLTHRHAPMPSRSGSSAKEAKQKRQVALQRKFEQKSQHETLCKQLKLLEGKHKKLSDDLAKQTKSFKAASARVCASGMVVLVLWCYTAAMSVVTDRCVRLLCQLSLIRFEDSSCNGAMMLGTDRHHNRYWWFSATDLSTGTTNTARQTNHCHRCCCWY
jgi:hypothetical protein